MDQGVLAVRVDNENAFAFFVKGGTEMHRDCAFSDPAFLLRYRDDFRCQISPPLLDANGFYLDEFLFQMICINEIEISRSAEVYAHKEDNWVRRELGLRRACASASLAYLSPALRLG
jgi:hypothetical protein